MQNHATAKLYNSKYDFLTRATIFGINHALSVCRQGPQAPCDPERIHQIPNWIQRKTNAFPTGAKEKHKMPNSIRNPNNPQLDPRRIHTIPNLIQAKTTKSPTDGWLAKAGWLAGVLAQSGDMLSLAIWRRRPIFWVMHSRQSVKVRSLAILVDVTVWQPGDTHAHTIWPLT